MKLYPYFVPHTKINSKCTGDLNVITKAIKLLEENTVVNHDQMAMVS